MGRCEVFVGVHGACPGWRRVLDQERVEHRPDDAGRAPVVVLSGRLPGWIADYVAAGGVAVVSGALPGDPLLPRGFSASVTGFTPPDRDARCQAPSLATLFEAEGPGEVRLHEDRVVKYDVDPDRFPAVVTVRHGRGALVASGLPLAGLLAAPGDRLRRFSRFSPVTERVASVDKAEVADTLLWMLRLAYRLAGLPWVSLPRFPGAAASVLILRIDVDGVYGENLRRLARGVTRCGLGASFYLNGDLAGRHPGPLDGWDSVTEVGQHAYLHTLLASAADNRANLQRAESWMREATGRSPTSFVAPRGLWNRQLGEALRDLGYRYSSDFGLDFDSLPFRSDAGVLQVPVHPYSPERASVWADENGLPAPTGAQVRGHYLAAVGEQVRRGRPAHVYGHPEVLGTMADDVLPALRRFADQHALPSLPLGAYADFWLRREEALPRVVLDDEAGRLDVRVADVGLPVRVEATAPLLVDVNGRGRGRVEACAALPP